MGGAAVLVLIVGGGKGRVLTGHGGCSWADQDSRGLLSAYGPLPPSWIAMLCAEQGLCTQCAQAEMSEQACDTRDFGPENLCKLALCEKWHQTKHKGEKSLDSLTQIRFVFPETC